LIGDDGEVFATSEIHGGAGYLSQSTPIKYFVLPENGETFRVRVAWPEGGFSEESIAADRSAITVSAPRPGR
jgi:hypothetical protein